MGLKCGCKLIQSRGHLTAILEAKDQKSKSRPWNAPGLQCELKKIKMEIFNKEGGEIPKSERPGSDIRNLPKRSKTAAYKVKRATFVACSPRVEPAESGLFY